jgi:hypothetical protein
MDGSGSQIAPLTVTNDVRAVAMQTLEAIVFREVLKPLAAGLGPVGEVALGSFADTLFARPKTCPERSRRA